MAHKPTLKTNFAIEKKHDAFYTGGKVQFNGDGSQMLCKCSETVNMLDVASGTILHTFGQEGDGEVSSFILSPDDKVFVLALRNLLLKQWDMETKEVTRTWKAIHTAPVSTMAFDSTSTLLATGGADASIKVWDVVQQYCTHNLRGHQGVITALAFHPDTDKLQLFSAGEDYNIRVWQLQTSACVAVLEGHYSVVTALQFSDDASTMLSGSRDQVVHVWDIVSFNKLRTIPIFETVESVISLRSDEDLSKLNVTSSNQHFITAGSKGILRVWNATTSQCVYAQKQSLLSFDQPESSDNEGSVITDAIYCPGTKSIAVVTYDHNICLYNSQDLSTKKQFAGYNDEVLDVKFLGPEETHIAVVTNSALIKVFELSSWAVQILRGHADIVLTLDVFKDGKTFASASKDNTIRLWCFDPETYRVHPVAAAYGHTHEILTVAFSRLSSEFLVSGSQDLTMKVWNVPSEFPEDTVVSLNARATEKAHDKDINSVAVSPNDKFIATGSQDKLAKLWNAEDLKMLGVFRGHKRGIWCVQFSPVDQCLATASSDCTVKIWLLTDFSCAKTFEGHDALVLKVHFVTRGMQLVTSGSDGLMKLWTMKTNECVKTLDEHADRVWALAISKTEDRVITGGGDSRIIVWKDVTEIEIEEKRNKQIDVILKEQTLMNLLQQKKYLKALGLAITLEQPFKALNIIKEIMSEEEGQQGLEETLAKLRKDQLDAILRFSVQWNTNSKHCHMAQHVLSTVLRRTTPEELLELPNAKAAFEGLLPYTEKHFQRMNRLLQQAMFVEYTWQTMRLAASDPMQGTSSIDALDGMDNSKLTRIKEKRRSQDSSSESSDESESSSGDEEDAAIQKHKDPPESSPEVQETDRLVSKMFSIGRKKSKVKVCDKVKRDSDGSSDYEQEGFCAGEKTIVDKRQGSNEGRKSTSAGSSKVPGALLKRWTKLQREAAKETSKSASRPTDSGADNSDEDNETLNRTVASDKENEVSVTSKHKNPHKAAVGQRTPDNSSRSKKKDHSAKSERQKSARKLDVGPTRKKRKSAAS